MIALALGTVVGCTHSTSVYRSPADVVAGEAGKPLDLRLTTGERYTIRDGRIQNDTLYAVSLGNTTAENKALAVPLSAIASLSSSSRGFSVADAAKVTLSAITIAAVLASVAVISLLLSLQ